MATFKNVEEFFAGLTYPLPGDALPEGDWVKLAIDYANKPTFNRRQCLLLGSRLPSDYLVKPGSEVNLLEADKIEHEAFVHMLDRVVRREKPDPLDEVPSEPIQIVILPEVSTKAGKLSVRFRFLSVSLSVALDYILRLIADPSKPYLADLHRCTYSPCSRFFFTSSMPGRRGAPRTKYCGDPCMDLVHNADSRKRVAISRRKRKEAQRAAKLKPSRRGVLR